jgi:HSP20 family molecular chaperone IbpA
MAFLFLILLPAIYISHGSAVEKAEPQRQPAPADTHAAGYNSLSKFNITHRQSEKELVIDVKGAFKDGVDAFIDNGRLFIRHRNADGTPAEESYALPAPVNENGIKSEFRENHITITAPLIAKNESNQSALRSKMDRMKKWHSLDKDIDSLFDFDNNFLSNDDVFGKNFFDDEFERINRQMRNMTKMHENLARQMTSRGFGPASAATQCKVSHKIENGNVVVTIEGSRLDNLEFKVEDDIFRVHNKISGLSEESSENQISKTNFQSSFSESFTLPAKVDSAKMRIDKIDGRITVTLPIVN